MMNRLFSITLAIFSISLPIMKSTGLQAAEIEYTIPSSIQPNSLLFHSWKKYSQFGEEGILDEILNRLNIQTGFFVEFGAWDAMYLSNTRFLAERGWKGAFIEADSERITKGKENCKDFADVECIHEFVSWETQGTQGKTLDQIADEYFPDEEIDVLSIDVDGPDYLILETLERRPKIIVIEGGIYWSPLLNSRIPDNIAKNEFNQPLQVIFDIAKKKGYTPVCYTINTFFIRDDLIGSFSEIQNDALSLWFDSWLFYETRIPEHTAYVRGVRSTNKWIRQYDPYTSL